MSGGILGSYGLNFWGGDGGGDSARRGGGFKQVEGSRSAEGGGADPELRSRIPVGA